MEDFKFHNPSRYRRNPLGSYGIICIGDSLFLNTDHLQMKKVGGITCGTSTSKACMPATAPHSTVKIAHAKSCPVQELVITDKKRHIGKVVRYAFDFSRSAAQNPGQTRASGDWCTCSYLRHGNSGNLCLNMKKGRKFQAGNFPNDENRVENGPLIATAAVPMAVVLPEFNAVPSFSSASVWFAIRIRVFCS